MKPPSFHPYFDEKYLLTFDMADENKKDTSVLEVVDKKENIDYIFYY